MLVVATINLALRFVLELCALAALAYWGFQTGRGPLAGIGLAIGAPLLAALIWGTFASPRAPMRMPHPWRLIIELAVFGLSVAALAAAGRPTLAWALGVAIAINITLLYLLGQRAMGKRHASN